MRREIVAASLEIRFLAINPRRSSKKPPNKSGTWGPQFIKLPNPAALTRFIPPGDRPAAPAKLGSQRFAKTFPFPINYLQHVTPISPSAPCQARIGNKHGTHQ